MRIFGKAGVLGITCVGAVVLAGCTINPDEAGRFREAVPKSEDVALRVPSRSGATTGTQSLRIQSPSTGATSENARFYTFTRDMTRGVDDATASILGAIWTVVSLEPTSVSANRAVWGPGYSSSLERNEWRFVATEVTSGEYDYTFEGRPKGGGDFQVVLRGKGYGDAHPSHRSGWFQIDNDAFRALEPSRAKDAGTVKVTYALASLPSTIAVEVRAGAKGSVDVGVTHESGGAGKVDINGQVDVEDTGAQLEDIVVASRWDATGAGRADARIENGDLSAPVTATECWSSSFSRVFYEDNANHEPTFGDATACVFPAQ